MKTGSRFARILEKGSGKFILELRNNFYVLNLELKYHFGGIFRTLCHNFCDVIGNAEEFHTSEK